MSIEITGVRGDNARTPEAALTDLLAKLSALDVDPAHHPQTRATITITSFWVLNDRRFRAEWAA